MASGIVPHKTDLQKVLECPLCLQQLENPKRLQPCYHSFCEECLNEVIPASGEDEQNIKCPVCEISVTQTDISENTFLTDLISCMKSGDILPEVQCKQCHGDPNMAVVKCVDCKIELCDNCRISHLKIPSLSDHICVNLQDVAETIVDKLLVCDSHNKPFEFDCLDCKELLCVNCIHNHFEHSPKSIKVAEKILIEQTHNMTRRMSKYCEVLQKNVNGIRQKIDDVSKAFDNCNEMLDNQLARLIEHVTAIRDRMKHDVSQQKEDAIRNLEKTKHGVECKKVRGEYLQNVVSVTLKHSKSSSLIKEMQSRLISSVENFIDVKTESPLHLRLPVPRIPALNEDELECLQGLFGELRSCMLRLDITSHGHVVQSHPVQSYPEIFRGKLESKCQVNDLKLTHRLSYINGKLWVPQEEQVNIYSNEGTLEKVLDIGRHVFSVKMAANGHVMFSGKDGLYYKQSEDADDIQITESPVYDITCCGNMLAAYKYQCKTIEIYQLEESHVLDIDANKCQWKILHSFQIDSYEAHSADTLMLTDTHLYISLTKNPQILKCTHDGCHVSSVPYGKKMFFLCGCDCSDNFVSCQYVLHELKISTTDFKLVQDHILSGDIMYPLDVVVDSELNVWVLQGLKTKVPFGITKFSALS